MVTLFYQNFSSNELPDLLLILHVLFSPSDAFALKPE